MLDGREVKNDGDVPSKLWYVPVLEGFDNEFWGQDWMLNLKLCLEFMDVEHLFEVVVNGEMTG